MGQLALIRRDLLLNGLLASAALPSRPRVAALRALGMRIGEGVFISPWCFFGGTDVEIGDGSYLQYRCFIDNAGSVRIGTRCSIGVGAMLVTGTHDIGPAHQRRGTDRNAPVVVGDGCWLGNRVTVVPGVTIGRGCVIGAGAVVAGDCAPDGVYAGVPARRVRDLA